MNRCGPALATIRNAKIFCAFSEEQSEEEQRRRSTNCTCVDAAGAEGDALPAAGPPDAGAAPAPLHQVDVGRLDSAVQSIVVTLLTRHLAGVRHEADAGLGVVHLDGAGDDAALVLGEPA